MDQTENCAGAIFGDYETLGDVDASAAQTRTTWRYLGGGFLLVGLILAAMLPTSLEQKIRDLPPGPIEDRMIQGVGWWRSQITSWHIDLPAKQLRQHVDDLSQLDWQTSYCALRATGFIDENLLLRPFTVNGGPAFECD